MSKYKPCTIHRYSDGHRIGFAPLTKQEFQDYLNMSQKPEGLISLKHLPYSWYELEPDYQNTSGDTTVFIVK